MTASNLKPQCAPLLWALLVVLLSTARVLAWPSSAESNVFDLRPPTFNTYFAGESSIFSLAGYEDTFRITLSASYSIELNAARITAYAYDMQNGADVTSGQATYRITQGGVMVASGNLTYMSGSRAWESGYVSFVGSGTYSVVAVINGHAQATSFTAGTGEPVPLTGTATDDNGSPLSGATVNLYNASTVFGASNLNNLPAPLATTTTPSNGTFNFGQRPVGQYILVIVTTNGTTIGPAFWLKNGETAHNETLVENPGRTALLGRMLSLRNSIQAQVVDRQTEWMRSVAHTVDGDLDATPDLLDWAILVANIASGTASAFQQAWQIGLSPSHLGPIAARVTGEELLGEGLTLAGTVTAEELASMGSQAMVAKGALAQPYYAYGASATTELADIDSALGPDVAKLYDPALHTPFLKLTFAAGNPVHRHSTEWFRELGCYQFAQNWLQTYYQEGLTELPSLPAQFDVGRAQSLFAIAESQLAGIATGTGQLYVSPHPSEWNSTSAQFEPLALNLYDYKLKYDVGRTKAEVLDWVSKGSGIASAYFTGAAAASAAGVVTLPGAAVGATAAAVAQGISLGASVYQATVKADMVATYVQMSAKYSANLLTAPLVLKRTDDFLITEVTSPYYFSTANQFAGNLETISLGGTMILGREVFFPVQLKLLPFMPPIQLTGENNASVTFSVPGGSHSPAVYRIESKVTDFSGAHDHVVIQAGQYGAGQQGQALVPFRGHLLANGIFNANKLESRLWVGPFQKEIKTSDFLVMPINIGLIPGPLSTQTIQEEMQKPLAFVKMDQQSLTGEDIVALADRVRERIETNLVVGANVVEKSYAFSNDVFEAEFRLYRPPGAKVRFSVWENGEYIGWDSVLSVTHFGFPGGHSGTEANPEWITVPNSAGRTLTVRMELDEVATEPVNLLLEVWEKPMRNAVMAVLPDSVNVACRTGIVHRIEVAVGENSHQQPLQAVSVALSSLDDGFGHSLVWTNTTGSEATNLVAGAIRVYGIDVYSEGAAVGTYTGSVTVTSANAGTVQVPVNATVDGQAPQVSIAPVQNWWSSTNGPMISWVAQDDVTASSNLLFSTLLEGWDSQWSGFTTSTNRDLSAIPDGTYVFRVCQFAGKITHQFAGENHPPLRGAVVLCVPDLGTQGNESTQSESTTNDNRPVSAGLVKTQDRP